MSATVSSARLRMLFALFAVATLILSARLVYWQTFGRGGILGRATDQVRSDLVLTAQRGIIRDRGGAILATTVELRSLYAIPAQMTDREKNDLRGSVATAIAPILGEKAEVLRAAFSSGAEWLFVRRRLPEATADRIAALHLPGLGFELEPKRLYPNGAIAAQVMGFVNDDGVGQYGVEGRYDAILRGVDGRLVVEQDPDKRELALGLRTAIAAQNGQDLSLTLDLATQTAAERELAAAVERERATSGSVVVMDPRDGAILALASSPTYDPAHVGSADPEALRDRTIAWTYEPGSTMKPITIAAALDKGVVTPATSYDDIGYAIIGGRRLSNALGRAYGPTNVTQILERSANAGAVFVASRLGAHDLYASLRTMLTATVDEGIANGASLPRYSVAGKTGTAQIPSPDGRYIDDSYISSFAGIVPASDPHMVVVVVLERPQSKLLGTIPAMNVFKGIATDALRYARVPPDRP